MLDSEQEADFDDIVLLASKICEAPVSLISLVDDDRQWFKARLGFEPTQTSLTESVCSHAILEDDYLEVPDMAEDARTADNPLHVSGPKVKFYAGANLIAPNGHAIGTLCVLDTKPRQLSSDQRDALKTLSRQVMMQLELRKKVKIEKALKSEMDHRVKNSLQTIASILRMASRKVTDSAALDVLELVDRRLSAVAALHSELMGQDEKSSVDMVSYVDQLGVMLATIGPDNIAIKLSSEAGRLEGRKASAIGMIVSEFVANSIKHGFPDNRSGQITVLLRQNADGWLMECSDNGVGNRQATSKGSENTGLGEILMASATMQLGGQIETEIGEDGARMTVTFGK